MFLRAALAEIVCVVVAREFRVALSSSLFSRQNSAVLQSECGEKSKTVPFPNPYSALFRIFARLTIREYTIL